MASKAINKNEVRTKQTRELLLKSAETVFVRDGYEAAELGEIAAMAGRSKGAIYNHFDSKEDLFLSLYQDRNAFYTSRLLELMSGSTSKEQNRKILRKFMGTLLEDEAWSLLLIEFKLFAKRHPDSKERFLKIYSARTPGHEEADYDSMFGDPGKGPAYLSRAIAIQSLPALLSALVIEREFAPALKERSAQRKLLSHLFDALMNFTSRVGISCFAEDRFFTSLKTPAEGPNMDSLLRENRVFPPPVEFATVARISSFSKYQTMYRQSVDDPNSFWRDAASEIDWITPFKTVLEGEIGSATWFNGGKLNLSHNCVDRHAASSRAGKIALLWEGEPGEVRRITFSELHEEVQRFANVLKELGVKKGDRVAVYMGMCPELAIGLLACARIGAIHSVIFGGFAAHAIVERVNDSQCVAILTQDISYRRGSEIKLKAVVDEALPKCLSVKNVVVYKRSTVAGAPATQTPITMVEGRDIYWHEATAKASSYCAVEPMDSEDPLYILYTSGTTGKPKGLVHTTGGYSVSSYLTSKYVFDLQDEDVYWCTADIGWVTGHSYVLYGPLQCGATTVLYEGAPNWPENDRFWKLVDDHKVSVFYTAPTAIRAFIKWGDQWVKRHSLSTLRLLGTVGEPINPEAWMWYHREIGKERCPIVDTWWQTETGAHMIAPIPGAVPTKPGSATLPFFGIVPDVVTKEGNPVPPGQGGLLIIRKPWPSLARTIYGDPERYRTAYFTEIPGAYFTGDGARCDSDGYYWLMGRVDDVINVSGHRLGTAELESALVAHPLVAEAAVVGRPDEMKGQAIAAFVTLEEGHEPSDELKQELRQWVAKEIGALARPDDLRFTQTLPKTRSGKIMRRVLRELATTGSVTGDVTTLEDLAVIGKLLTDDQ